MQILDYDNNENATHVCLSCDTEFSINIYNDGQEQTAVAFCPCCGEPLYDEIDEQLEDYDDSLADEE